LHEVWQARHSSIKLLQKHISDGSQSASGVASKEYTMGTVAGVIEFKAKADRVAKSRG
jgi:hypothetical protein